MSYLENQNNELQPRSFKNKEVRGFGLNSIIDLYLHPGRFFSEHKLDLSPWYFFATWILGMATTIDRIDRNLVKADLGTPRPGMDAVAGSWATFWAVVIISGLLSGYIGRWIGGWFYGVRLAWSGAKHFDRQKARQVLVYSSLVAAIPAVLGVILMTPIFENYSDYWQNSPAWGILLIIFPFWSIITGYRGARTCFDTARGRALFWFLILPLAFYTIAVGAFTVLYALFG